MGSNKEIQQSNLVAQSNAISRAIYSCSVEARRLIAMAMEVYEKEKPANHTVSFTASDFWKALGLKPGGKTRRLVKAAIEEAIKTIIKIEYEDYSFEAMPWFIYTLGSTKFVQELKKEMMWDWDKITMRLNPILAERLGALKFVGFTTLELQDVGKLKSLYAIRFYEIARSWMGKAGQDGNRPGEWWFKYSIEELRHVLNVDPKKYKVTNDFRKKVIELPLREIKDSGIGISIDADYEKGRRGRRLADVWFSCKLLKSGERDVTPDTEQREIEWYETNQPEKFEECLDEVIKSDPERDLPWVSEDIKRESKKPDALELIKKKYPEIKPPWLLANKTKKKKTDTLKTS